MLTMHPKSTCLFFDIDPMRTCVIQPGSQHALASDAGIGFERTNSSSSSATVCKEGDRHQGFHADKRERTCGLAVDMRQMQQNAYQHPGHESVQGKGLRGRPFWFRRPPKNKSEDSGGNEQNRPKPADIIVQQGLHPHPGPDSQEITIESINCTHLVNNAHFILRREADVIGFQEHELPPTAVKDMQNTFKKSGWDMMCGPVEQTSKRINAGAGSLPGNT